MASSIPNSLARPNLRGPAGAAEAGVVVVTAVALAVVVIVPILYPGALTGGPRGTRFVDPIQHIVIVMMENRAFDSYFGTYCSTVGPYCPSVANGIPPGTCVPYDPTNPARGCVTPFAFTRANLSVPDLPHSWNSTVRSIDNGSMDGFYRADRGPEGLGHYDGSTIPGYWDIAQTFGLGDDFFSSALSYSLPNHWYLLAGQAPHVGFNATDLAATAGKHAYLNEANQTKSVEDLLNATPSVSWKYYDWALSDYQTAINGDLSTGAIGSAYSYWNPLAGKAESYQSWYSSHFVLRSTFFADAAQGALPNVAWVIPDPQSSDHPPANISVGESFVTSILDSVMQSPDWSSTAVFVTWDDYGGFYDHVAPPSIDPLGLSFRVPLLVVSPWTSAGLVVHSLQYFESLLHFVEWRFGLGCITPRDCNAPLPLGFFNFNQTLRTPVFFDTNPFAAQYPMPALGAAGAPNLLPAEWVIDPMYWDSAPPPPGTPELSLD